MKTNRLIFADILRIAATISVITIHTVGQLFYTDLNSIPIEWWWLGNTFSCLSRWAVPMFLMLSGMLLLDINKKISIDNLFKKRIPKLFFPLIFWSIFYELYNTIYINKLSPDWLQLLSNIYHGKVQYHLWFLYLIIALYLFTPILRAFIKNSSQIEFHYTLLTWLVVNSFIQSFDTYFGLQNGVYLSIFLGYSGYYLLGYYLNKISFKESHKSLTMAILCISVLVSMLLTYLLASNGLQVKMDVIIGNLSPFTMINSICIFVIAKSTNWEVLIKNNSFLAKAIESFSRSSYGIYLLHILILGLLSSKTLKLALNYKFVHPIIGIPITVIATLIVSYICVQILRKIKLLNCVLPY